MANLIFFTVDQAQKQSPRNFRQTRQSEAPRLCQCHADSPRIFGFTKLRRVCASVVSCPLDEVSLLG
jgi:hypothetical protein